MIHPLQETQAQQTAEAALEKQANELLWQTQTQAPGHLEYPFYSERWLRERCRQEQGAPEAEHYDALATEQRRPELLTQILQAAELPENLRRALELAGKGMPTRDIAETLGVSRRTALRWVTRGRDLLCRQRCRLQTLLERNNNLVMETYHESLSVGSYHEERHCKAGKEACRRDGLCKYRWYLHITEDNLALD